MKKFNAFKLLKYIMSLVYPAIGIYILIERENLLGNRKIEIILAILLIVYGIYRAALSWNEIHNQKKEQQEL